MYNALGIKIMHSIILNQNVDVDKMRITSGGSLTINDAITLTVQNGANTGTEDDSDLVIDDTIIVNGTLLLGSSATLEVTTNGSLTKEEHHAIKHCRAL